MQIRRVAFRRHSKSSAVAPPRRRDIIIYKYIYIHRYTAYIASRVRALIQYFFYPARIANQKKNTSRQTNIKGMCAGRCADARALAEMSAYIYTQ